MNADELKALKERLGLLEQSEVAALLTMTIPSLRNQRARNQGPPFTRICRKVFYPVEGLRQYFAAATVTPKPAPTLIDGKRRRERQAAA
jgi:hypothetical protein